MKAKMKSIENLSGSEMADGVCRQKCRRGIGESVVKTGENGVMRRKSASAAASACYHACGAHQHRRAASRARRRRAAVERQNRHGGSK
jgi:hypothetical protein